MRKLKKNQKGNFQNVGTLENNHIENITLHEVNEVKEMKPVLF